MNTKYETGNVIRSSSDFSGYKFPAELPTEEWAGNEARSYTNYIRPIANLFENDRENESLAKDLYEGWMYDKNSVIHGCKVEKTTIGADTYYEVQHGAFINGSFVYYIYPACEAVAKQIEREYELAGNVDILKIKITYDYATEEFNYSYILNDVESTPVQCTKAVEVVSGLLTALELTNPIESHVILPILKNADSTTIYFDGTSITQGTPTGNGNTIIATTASGVITQSSVVATVNGHRIENSTINNDKIINNKITIGSTVMNLGDSKADFTGVTSINKVRQNGNNGAIELFYRDNGADTTTLIVPNGVSYTLGNACEKTFDTDVALTTNANLPTNSAVKGYITSLMAGTVSHFTGNMTFDNGLTIINGKTLTSNGQIKTSNNTNASLVSNNLSGNASIYTDGGIEAQKDIYSKGNIVGLNAGTYSKRELKENITDFTEDAVELINGVKIVNYNYKADGDKNHKIGFIADDTHEYFSTVNHNIMDQSNCIGILLAAVQQLSAENKALKEKLDGIESKLNSKRRKHDDNN